MSRLSWLHLIILMNVQRRINTRFCTIFSITEKEHFSTYGTCVCSVMPDSLQAMDCSLPGSSVHGILQARILEWVAISYSTNSLYCFVDIKTKHRYFEKEIKEKVTGEYLSWI